MENDKQIGRLMLHEAQDIADRCGRGEAANFSNAQLWTAFQRLRRTTTNGGVRNSERAMARLNRRLAALGDEIIRRPMA